MTKLSIITINRNNAEGLRKTMESVFAQTYRDIEYIVVDGASTDGSVEVIKDYVNQLQIDDCKFQIYWVSEPDKGIYEAMNHGLEIAMGRRAVNADHTSSLNTKCSALNESQSDDYVLMLNSGDYLVDEHVIERIVPELHTEDMIQGNIIEDLPSGTVRDRGYGRSDISFIDAMEANFLHQAIFIRLETMEKYGYYDASYKKGSDTYFFTTALGFGNATFRYVDIDIANFDISGISAMSDPKWRQIDQEEDARWYGEHISNRLMDLYHTAPKKMRLYDQLHKHKFIWCIAMGLARFSEWLSPTQKNNKIEKIK